MFPYGTALLEPERVIQYFSMFDVVVVVAAAV